MIQFSFDWDSVLSLGILALVVLLLPLQLWLLLRKGKPVLSPRLLLRMGLNVVLWLVVLLFVLQPYTRKEHASETGIILATDVSSSFRKKLTDSLKKAEVLNFSAMRDVENLSTLDTILLVGQNFDENIYHALLRCEAKPILKWVPFRKENEVNDLHWKGIVRRGERQELRGGIETHREQSLSIHYGDQVLDSIKLGAGRKSFKLSFPVFTEGRTLAVLKLSGVPLDTIRYFARPAEPLTFQFLLDNPDFETRNLATWLGKNGHSVLYHTVLSKGIHSKQTINSAKEADVIITSPDNASHTTVKKGLTAGKSILFINLTNPADEISKVNSALGTSLVARKISSEETVPVSAGLTALPYRFLPANHYVSDTKYPVAVEQVQGAVGVSLLSETFPLLLAGDSIAYQNVWHALLATIHPATRSNIEVNAPVHENVLTEVSLNDLGDRPKMLRMGSDSVFLNYSTINGRSSTARFRPMETGWLSLSDSLKSEIYIQPHMTNGDATQVKDFIRSYSFESETVSSRQTVPEVHPGARRKPSDWTWYVALILCLTLVWVERKL